jgi:hypothetical protein
MNPRQILLGTLAIATVSYAHLACAQEATQAAWPDSTQTRATVQAELAQARQDRSIKVSSVTYGQPAASARSRDDVRAELAQARASGIKVSSVTYGQPASSTRSREEVRAETAAAHGGAGMLNSGVY